MINFLVHFFKREIISLRLIENPWIKLWRAFGVVFFVRTESSSKIKIESGVINKATCFLLISMISENFVQETMILESFLMSTIPK